MVVVMIGVAATIAAVVGDGVSDRRTPYTTHDRSDRTADNRPGNRAPDSAGDQAVLVGKSDLGRRAKQNDGENKNLFVTWKPPARRQTAVARRHLVGDDPER